MEDYTDRPGFRTYLVHLDTEKVYEMTDFVALQVPEDYSDEQIVEFAYVVAEEVSKNG